MNRDDALNFLIVWTINLIFLGLIALLLWPLGELALAKQLAWGSLLLWSVLLLSGNLVLWIEKILHIDMYSNFDGYVVINLLASLLLVLGWAAFAAMVIGSRTANASGWLVATFYVIGFLSTFLSASLVSEIYSGSIYRLISIPAALLSFVLFTVWPASGQFLYGWFFALF